jgi:hypothetical protein
MALQHLRSGTANKRPTPAGMSDGQLAMNTNSASPGLFLKDSSGALVKVGPVHVGTTAPNASPASGGQSGNSVGEQWLDTSSSTYVFKIWDGSAWRSEAGEFVNASGDTMTGALVMDNQQQVRFRETTANGTNFIALQAPASVASDKTITLPDVTGTVVTTGDTGTVTSTMLLDGTIVNADVNASAAIAGTKIAPDFGSQTIATTGVFSHALGAAATPSVTFTGDTNTGIYSPGADQVAISTNGTGRLFVDASGNVGVAYSSPSNFAGGDLGASAPLVVGDGTGSRNLTLFSANNVYGSLAFADSTTGSAKYAGLIQYYHVNDTMQFYTGSTQRMVIDSSGRLGLGTSSPNNRLHVSDTSSTSALFERTGTTGAFIALKDSATQTFIGNTNGVFSIQTPGSSYSDKLVVTSTGLVGIGTTAPNQIVTANGYMASWGSSAGYLLYDSTGATYWGGIEKVGNNIQVGTNQSQPLLFIVGNGERARFDTSGRLLVGTSTGPTGATSQYSLLTVRSTTSGGSAGAYMALTRASNSASTGAGDLLGLIVFGDQQAGEYAHVSCQADGTAGTNDYPGRLVFSTTADGASSPTERMRINNLGTVNIFSGDQGLNSRISASSATNEDIFLGRHSATSTSDGTICFQVKANGNVLNTNNSYGAISDAKLKENIVDANPQWDDLKALQVRNYNLKEGQTHTQIGLIAQEVELVSPGLVNESLDRDAEGNDLGTVTKSVNYSVLYMKAVKALQEAMERIEVLEQRLTDAGIA